ncbi:MAG: phosphotransferase family protein, partial [Oscillospiraceae bacterium]
IQKNVQSKRVPLLNMLIEKMHRKISAADIDATTRYDLHTRLNGMKRHLKLCHGDFNPSNIIITADGTPYIIDWAHATQGNAAADAARTYLLFYLQGKNEIGDKYLKLFCKKTDTAIQYVQKWIPIVAASRLVKAPEDEKEFLMRWIDVVDYE